MARYGNILVLYGEEWDEHKLKNVLEEEGVSFKLIDNVCFIMSLSKVNTSDVIKRVREVADQFIFFHNHNPDGSSIKSAGIDQETLDYIDSLLFR